MAEQKIQQNQKPSERRTVQFGGGPMQRAMMGGQKPKNFKKSLGRLIRYLAPYYRVIAIALVCSALSTLLAIFGPKYIGRISDEIVNYFRPEVGFIDFTIITKIGLMLASFYVVSAIMNYLQHFFMSGVQAKTSRRLRKEISEKINRLPLKYFDTHQTGDILSRVTNDVDTISQTLNQSLSSIIASVCQVVGMLIMMITYKLPHSLYLTAIPVATVPLGMLIVSLIIKISQKYFRKQSAVMGATNAHIEEIYSAQPIVKVFNAGAKARAKFDALNSDLKRASWKSQFFSGLMMPLFMLIANLGVICVSIFGGTMALDGLITIGMVQSFIIYVRQFNQPVSQLATIASTLQSTAAASERVFEFLDANEQEKEPDKLPAPTNIKGEVEFKDVNFGYDPEKQIIHNFSLTAKAGSKIAIVGHTGAGKTTIVNLLMRFYEIWSGDILIDGVSTQKYRREDVRKMFAMVLQDTWLFEGTIAENVKYSLTDIDEQSIKKACKAANIDHFIRTLPEGYETLLKEETSLSAGQRQLLTIARCMIQNAPMLILDEATSNVDTRTEILIQQAMDRLMEGRTSFIIAHRLSTIKNADIILVMRDGSVIETGNHEQLLQSGGHYASLYNSQFSEQE